MTPEPLLVTAARGRGVTGPVLLALAAVPRARFVLPEARGDAGRDVPLPIGRGHHSAEPSVLARMVSLAGVTAGARVLELGAGTGYVAALAAAIGARVTAVERDPVLAAAAAEVLGDLGLAVHVLSGTATRARLPGAFDAVLFGGAVVGPGDWLDALAEGGVLCAPIGSARHQELVTWTRDGDRFDRHGHGACRFEPLGSPDALQSDRVR